MSSTSQSTDVHRLFVMVLGALVWPALALAQEPAPRLQDRVIPDDCFCEIGLDTPSVPRAVGQIARSTRVPLGLEYLSAPTVHRYDLNQRHRWLVGLTVGEALDIITKLDPSYAWSETQGAIVVRPLLSWNDKEHFLEQKIGPFSLDEPMDVAAVLNLIGGFFRGESYRPGLSIFPFDDARISMSLPSASLIDVLNAVVAAHGALMWTIEYCWPSLIPPTERGSSAARCISGPPSYRTGEPHQVWFDVGFSNYGHNRSRAIETLQVPNPAIIPGAVLEAPYLPGRTILGAVQ